MNFILDRESNLIKVPFKDGELIFDSPEDMYYLYDTLPNKNKINWKFDKNNDLLYCRDDNNDKIYLIEKIINDKILHKIISFIDNNKFNYSKKNIKIELIDFDLSKFTIKENYIITKKFYGHKSNKGKNAGKYNNPYCMVKNNLDDTEYCIMLCEPYNTQTFISLDSINFIKEYTWFNTTYGICTALNIDDNKKILKMHQYIFDQINKNNKKKVIHKNKNILDNRIENLIIEQDNIPENFPNLYEIIESFDGRIINKGKKSGQTFNRYWLVYNKIDPHKTRFYLMSCNENQYYFLLSEKSLNYIIDKTWFKSDNGYITTIENVGEKRTQYYLHQLICKTENGDESATKSVDHINRDKLDNRIENLRWATQSEQNANTDKRNRKHNAKPLPEGITQEDLPKYVVYYHEWLDKEKTKSREYFKIEKHPKQNKIWIGTKSNKVTIQEKLQEAKKNLAQIDGN